MNTTPFFISTLSRLHVADRCPSPCRYFINMMQTMNASTAKSSVVRSTRLGAAPRVALPARRSVIRRFKEDVSEASTSEKVKVSFKFPHHVDFGENICVVGAHDSLGSWDVGSSVPLNWNEGDVWTAELELPLE